METMDSTLDATTSSTVSMLEERIYRIEHVLYGHTAPQPDASATRSLHELEHRFSKLLQHIRVYGELLRLYKSLPSLFQPPPSSEPPSELSLDALRTLVLASAPSYPATASALTAISDTPIPDPAQSASLVGLLPRMRGIEATQLAQAAEVAELRSRTEAVIHHWLEWDVMRRSDLMAATEGRIERVERRIRQVERSRDEI
ncbi:hypothetical protein GGR56DRAFT_674683 [Xylariaceae sp. FL0804]|nr:hypothetical protein GGR56DRAFT_674683 [Xylariaceae sp. FL0804]